MLQVNRGVEIVVVNSFSFTVLRLPWDMVGGVGGTYD